MGTDALDNLSIFSNLRKANEARMEEWPGSTIAELVQVIMADPNEAARTMLMLFSAVELAGEVGEALNVVKKIARSKMNFAGNKEENAELYDNLWDELGDVNICNDLLAIRLGVDLDRATADKFNKTSDKIGLVTKLSWLPER